VLFLTDIHWAQLLIAVGCVFVVAGGWIG